MRIFIIVYLFITLVLNIQAASFLPAAETDQQDSGPYNENGYAHDDQSDAAEAEDGALPEESAEEQGYYEEEIAAGEGQAEFLQEEDGPLYEEQEDEVNDATDAGEENRSAPEEG